jgi:hypothetical protein
MPAYRLLSIVFLASSVAACADPAASTGESEVVDIEPCTPPTDVIVPAGGTLARPSGSALRLEVVYQAGDVMIENARGVDMTLPPGDTVLEAGVNSGYWYELRNASGETLYTRTFQDPSRIEVPLADGTMTTIPIPRCTPVTVAADVPNRSDGVALVFFGSPHGTMKGARELTRFTLR